MGWQNKTFYSIQRFHKGRWERGWDKVIRWSAVEFKVRELPITLPLEKLHEYFPSNWDTNEMAKKIFYSRKSKWDKICLMEKM
jgi:hypothetical protein